MEQSGICIAQGAKALLCLATAGIVVCRAAVLRMCGATHPEEEMPQLTTDDGVKLHYDDTGSGIPIVFVHEFAGDHRSWEPQVRYFARRYRCITYAARGYPP